MAKNKLKSRVMSEVGQGRQGDVFLDPVNKIPKNVKEVPRENGRVVLAHGEVSGHAHVFDSPAVKMVTDGERRWIEVNEDAEFKHGMLASPDMRDGDHDTEVIKKGKYEVVQQDEYSEEGRQQVID